MARLGRSQPFAPQFGYGQHFNTPFIYFNVLTLSGQVTLAAVGVLGAIIRVVRQSTDQEVFKTTTDASGNYKIAGDGIIPGETYHIMVEYTNAGTKYNAKSIWDVQPIYV